MTYARRFKSAATAQRGKPSPSASSSSLGEENAVLQSYATACFWKQTAALPASPRIATDGQMATAFAEALAAFDLRMDEFNRHATRDSGEMHERVLKSRQLCSES